MEGHQQKDEDDLDMPSLWRDTNRRMGDDLDMPSLWKDTNRRMGDDLDMPSLEGHQRKQQGSRVSQAQFIMPRVWYNFQHASIRYIYAKVLSKLPTVKMVTVLSL